MFLLYSFLYSLTVFILFLPEYLKRPKEVRGRWLREKFGLLKPEIRNLKSGIIWIHAVSVGEVNASIPLLKKIHTEHPEFQIILSTITDTGQKVAENRAPEGTKVVYLPFDLRSILTKTFSKIKPKMFIVIETELWPNLFRVLNKMGVPVLLLNGRISEKSSKGYKKIFSFMEKALSHVTAFGMQSKIDADRLKDIGADAKKIRVIGNFKFDMDMQYKKPLWAVNIKGPVIIAGSTFNGEEELILSAYRENLDRFHGLKLIIAPRHPERFKEVEDMLKSKEIQYVKRTELETRNLNLDSSKDQVILLDSIGELSSVYGIADIAIMGKSFKGFGGQNPLEPAFWGKPILCGPHMENFPFIKDFYDEGAAFEVDSTTLAKRIKELLIDPERAKASGEKARAIYMRNSGAVDRAMDMIRGYL